jgi:hypothetical protein
MYSGEHSRALCKTGPILAVFAALFLQPVPLSAVSPLALSGTLSGTVRDVIGKPQMGAIVFLYDHRDKLCERVVTDSQGGFSFGGLVPDFYTVRVTLSSFLPALRDHIQIQAGGRKMLQVNLSTLFSSVQLVAPEPGQESIMSDDWKWILRTSGARRPVLRILPGITAPAPGTSQRARGIFSDTHGMVLVTGGDASNDADLGTAFGVATSVYGVNQLQFVGNVGYVSSTGLPSAGFLTTLGRRVGDSTPSISIGMRQLSVPGRTNYVLAGVPGVDAGTSFLRTMSASTSNSLGISDSLDLEYGVAMDSISFLQRQQVTSAHARLTYSFPWAMVDFSYVSGNDRPQAEQAGNQRALGETADLERDVTALSTIPRVSLRNGHSAIQRSENYELGISRVVGSRQFRVAGYRESIQNTALTASLPSGGSGDGFSGQILPDFFSNTSVFNAGDFHSVGYTVSVAQKLGANYRVVLIYGYSGVLVPGGAGNRIADADALRALLHTTHRSALTTRASGTIARTGTKFSASYQWTDYRTVTSGHAYGVDGSGSDLNHPEAGLNLYVRQPIPSSFRLPQHMEFTLDVRNMLAEGYVPFTLVDGRRLLLMRTPRAFRGGLSFTF